MSMETVASPNVTVTLRSSGLVEIDDGVECVAILPSELPAPIAALVRIRDEQAGGAK